MSKDFDFIDDFFKDDDFKEISDAAKRMKNDILMEEPCPIYEGNEDDWEKFWYEDTFETD